MKENIYSTVPREITTDPEKAQALCDHLRNNKGSFYTAKKLTGICGFKQTGTQIELRKSITELIEINKIPIIANVKGFSWAVHSNQITFYIETLVNRVQGLQRRINALMDVRKNMEDENGMDK